MKNKRRHKDSITPDLRLSIILTGLLMLSAGRYLIEVQQSVGRMLATLFLVTVSAAPLIFAANPPLLKAAAESPNRVRRLSAVSFLIVGLSAALWGFSAGHAGPHTLTWTTIWMIGGLLLTALIDPAKVLSKTILLIWLWLLFFIGHVPNWTAPLSRPLVQPLAFAALLSTIGLNIYLPRLDVGFTFRLKADEVRQIVLNFILLFLVLLIFAPFTGLLTITDHLPSFLTLLTQGVLLFFLVALPEELLFRAVFYKYFLQIFQGRKWAVGTAIFASSLLFALAKSRSPLPPSGPYFMAADSPFSWSYAFFSFVAGGFYAWIFIRTKKLTAAVWLHALLDWVWMIFFRG
ncbi:MAG: CPBP family intramembrane metalloprotease [candidate division KSB1 bacterium]|nr:CPBP family intramembrane metalloprotease [candidate division KSB1 bacterium]